MSNNDNSIPKILEEINFKMGKKLGEGMFSAVKLGTHSITNEQVSIKILEKTKISKIEDKERINREISIMKKVKHYNIAKLYAVIETKLNIFLIQEYIQGKELIEYLNKKGKLKEVEACKFFHQIISGLDYLHQCGIAHRDFKPENIILTNDNQILKIIDFGLSHAYKKGELLKTACGSPCYVPPEMVKEEKYNGALSDIWSAGVILYLMLCGKLPFYDDDNQILYEKILSGKYEVPDHLSDNAKDILSKIIEIDPKKRINFEGIKSHPWFNIINKNYLIHKGINVDTDIIPIDEEIIEKMEKMGLNKVEIRYNLLKNYHNKITTIYDLLLKQKMDKGLKSISDMNSDIFDEYINNKKNKIIVYGKLKDVLKYRIGDNQQIENEVPDWPEYKYDDNNEKMIIGDTGSVIERLIKAGKFTYDEENMCLSRVTSKNISKLKNKNNDDDRFKTISSMQSDEIPQRNRFKTISATKRSNNANNKFRAISSIQSDEIDNNNYNMINDNEKDNKTKSPDIPKTRKNKVHFKDGNEKEDGNEKKNENIKKDQNEKKEENNSPKKKSNLKKKEEKKVKREEDEDWYKEMEELIDIENRRLSDAITDDTVIKKSTTVKVKHKVKKSKKDNQKIFKTCGNDDDDDDDIEIELDIKKNNKLCLSTNPSKMELKNVTTKKKTDSKLNNNTKSNNEDHAKTSRFKSSKDLKSDIKKSETFKKKTEIKPEMKSEINNDNKVSKTAKAKKTVRKVKNIDEIKSKNENKNRENSTDKNVNNDKKPSKFKKINANKDELNKEDEKERRNQSAQRRKIKIKI